VKNFEFQKVVQDELSLVEKLRQEKYEKVLKNLEYVTAIEGKAKFVSKNEVEIDGEKLSAEKFIIATGSTTNVPPIEGIRET
jgi:mercuric reductase